MFNFSIYLNVLLLFNSRSLFPLCPQFDRPVLSLSLVFPVSVTFSFYCFIVLFSFFCHTSHLVWHFSYISHHSNHTVPTYHCTFLVLIFLLFFWPTSLSSCLISSLVTFLLLFISFHFLFSSHFLLYFFSLISILQSSSRPTLSVLSILSSPPPPPCSLSSDQPRQVSVLQVWLHLSDLWRWIELHHLEGEEENTGGRAQTLLLHLGLHNHRLHLYHWKHLPIW